jgi:hypothetical protein
MEYAKIDSNNNILKIVDSKENDCLEIGKDIFWKVDVKRNGQIKTIFVNEMLENGKEEVVKFYDNIFELKLSEENGVKTIRFKTLEEKQSENIKIVQQKILNGLQPLMNAMNFQENSIIKGADNKNKLFSDKQIKDFGNYIGEIANGNIEAVIPELPEGYKNIL